MSSHIKYAHSLHFSLDYYKYPPTPTPLLHQTSYSYQKGTLAKRIIYSHSNKFLSINLYTNQIMHSTLSDVFISHPIHIPLSNLPDFTSLRHLPDSYTWTPKDDLLFSASSSDESLPFIDLSDPHVATRVGHACTTWGAFQITNHGVPSRLLDDIEFLTGSLFRLPVHRKLKAARREDGISGYGVARIASFFNKQMWSEGFTVIGSPLDDFHKLWPRQHLKYWYLHIFILFFLGQEKNYISLSKIRFLVTTDRK